MDADVQSFLERRFRIPESTEDKTTSLAAAVERLVRPGDTVHLGLTHTRGGVALWEILRRFHGTDPGFTLCGVQLTSPQSPLVHAGLARKLVTSWAGDSYWAPGPSPVYQRAWKAGVEFEHWSILTYAQRLAAAARGLPWATTRSLAGSTMAEDNAPETYRELEPGVGLVAALVPDVSVVHAPAADPAGNVVLTPPLMENVYGALAARRGAIVTVERIVDASMIRDAAHLVRLPAGAASAVVEAPLGGHPGGLSVGPLRGIRGLGDVEAYGDDYEFWADIRDAARDPAAMDTWIKEWVIESPTHEAYLSRLGRDRIERLKRRADPQLDREELEGLLGGVDVDAAYSEVEMAVVAAARVIRDRVKRRNHRVLLAGAGMSNLAAWLAGYQLADDGVAVDLAAEMGLVGYWPRPGEPMLFNQRNFPTCSMLTDIDWTLSILVGGSTARAIGSLGAAQLDRRGNINSTLIPGDRLLMGSGGANDVATCAAETVVIAVQSPDRFLDRVPYVTAPGDRVTAVVSQLGVYEKDGDELILVSVCGEDVESAVREARSRCGWDLRVAREVDRVEPPSREELHTIRLMDPRGWFRS